MRHVIMVLLAAAVLVLNTAPAYADLGDQLAKLLADDGAAEDRFGVSVAISGTTIIVGARLDDDNGTSSGSAYLFNISDPANPKQIAKLLPDDGAEQDQFGLSVAMSGAIAIVGARRDDDSGSDSGSAYLFDVATGEQTFKLLANDGAAHDQFGGMVAISGGTAIVGAGGDDGNGLGSGSAYLFDVATGQQTFKLLANDGAADDIFGSFVAISGTTAIVGAPWDDDNGSLSGSAYLFDTTTGQQLAKLLADDGAADDRFGTVAIYGATVIVGASSDDDNGSDSGSAYLFGISDPTNPTQIAKLLANDGAEGDAFGGMVAISGTTALISAVGDDDNGSVSGSAYLFDTTTGQQIGKLRPDDGAEQDRFGWSVAINGATAIVGANMDDDNGEDSGSAYLFDLGVVPSCPADIDGDGNVDFFEILAILAAWGCMDCPEDIDGSGTAGFGDILIVLATWGPCT